MILWNIIYKIKDLLRYKADIYMIDKTIIIPPKYVVPFFLCIFVVVVYTVIYIYIGWKSERFYD